MRRHNMARIGNEKSAKAPTKTLAKDSAKKPSKKSK